MGGLFTTSAIILFGMGLGYFWGLDSEIIFNLLAMGGITFVLGVIVNIATTRPYGVKVRGYEGILHRVLKAPGQGSVLLF